ncbi:MAG: Chondroitinase-AC [Verrucomicrobiae bacterium]|nr:Chondroitinase-AC [Verrucomicrobiae bacterium]
MQLWGAPCLIVFRMHVRTILLTWLIALNVGGVEIPEVELHHLKQQLREILTESNDSSADWASSLQADGTWADIDYRNQNRGGWVPFRHLDRLYQMIGAGAAEPAIHRALGHWLAQDYRCPNWWYNEIGVPRKLAECLLLFEGKLTDAELTRSLEIIKRATIGRTGQNKVWQAGIVFMRALLENDAELAGQARAAILSQVIITTAEGIQPDFSFHQHAAQQQFGVYGLSFARDIQFWEHVVHGTRFAFGTPQAEVFRRYLSDGLRWVSWNGVLDISACGRELFPGSPANKGQAITRLLQKANLASPPIGQRHFWRSDYTVHRSSNYFVSVKMCSDRVIGTESLNRENLQGLHLADGATFVYVTDGQSGLSVLDYARDSVTGRKSWFFLDNAVVCLGAGFQSAGDAPLVTTVNQSLLDGPVTLETGNTVTNPPAGLREFAQVRWAHHAGIGYVFPAAPAVTVSSQSQTGDWSSVCPNRAQGAVTKDVFALWLDHGQNPAAAHYAYLLLPARTPEQTAAFARQPTVEILRNDRQQQAVRSKDRQRLLVAFYEPGEIEGVTGSAPCLLLLRQTPTGPQVTVADPTQKLSRLQVTIAGKPLAFALPTGDQAGSSVTQTW